MKKEKLKQQEKPGVIPVPVHTPVTEPHEETEVVKAEEDPDLVPEEDPFETPVYEPPVEGEAP